MKAILLYRPDSEFARRTEEYAHDFQRNRNQVIELMNIDSKEGTALAELYGMMQYPALVVVREDGQVLKDWQGIDQLPLMNELASYLAS